MHTYTKNQFYPHRKHSLSTVNTDQLVMYGETIAVYCANHIWHINTICEKNAEILNIKYDGKYKNH